jgi:hypothetical protein
MPNKSLVKWLAEWNGLIAAVDRHEAEVPQLGLFKAALSEALGEIDAARLQRSNLETKRLQSTADLYEAMSSAAEMATRLRSLVKGLFGPQDERLSEFGLKPARRRRRKPPASRGETAPPATTRAR